MRFTAEKVGDGVVERRFELQVHGEVVPGLLWSPCEAAGRRPLLLLGHGGSQHKQMPHLVARAQRYVTSLGFAVAAIDAPSHGDRPMSERTQRFIADIRAKMERGQAIGEVVA